jgi:hypothetical protein
MHKAKLHDRLTRILSSSDIRQIPINYLGNLPAIEVMALNTIIRKLHINDINTLFANNIGIFDVMMLDHIARTNKVIKFSQHSLCKYKKTISKISKTTVADVMFTNPATQLVSRYLVKNARTWVEYHYLKQCATHVDICGFGTLKKNLGAYNEKDTIELLKHQSAPQILSSVLLLSKPSLLWSYVKPLQTYF